jgi:hypothetical protein
MSAVPRAADLAPTMPPPLSAEERERIRRDQIEVNKRGIELSARESPATLGNSRINSQILRLTQKQATENGIEQAWLDAREARDKKCNSSVSSVSEGSGVSQDTPWQEPEALVDALSPVMKFDQELLPEALCPWVLDITERTQAPIEYVAVSALVSAGAALGRKVAVRPKRLDDWYEFPNLWGAVVGPPSWMKSPALDEGKRPLAIIESDLLANFDLLHREWEADSECAKVMRDGARDRARKAAAKGDEFDKQSLVAQLIPDEPQPQRLIVNNATIPALCEVLRFNQNGVLVYRDELSGLIAELDQEGMEGARSFYLTGWSGKEPYVEDRIGRGTNLRVPAVCLSLLGGILRNSRDVGPRFHGMSVQHFAACRPGISRHVGPVFHGMSVQFVRQDNHGYGGLFSQGKEIAGGPSEVVDAQDPRNIAAAGRGV